VTEGSSIYDVIVVGAGAAGLAAAVEASSAGARTLVLEKEPLVGGTTRFAVGSVSAAGTSYQRAAGITDSTDAFVEDMAKFIPGLTERDNQELRRMLAESAAGTIEWLTELGVVFAGPFAEPPNRVPRMHNAIPNAGAYIKALHRAARRRGVVLHTKTAVRELLTSADDRVIGVRAANSGQLTEYHARRGVVLATGDFGGNESLRRKYLSQAAGLARPVNAANQGDGLRLGQSVGAELRNMDVSFAPQLRFWRPSSPSMVERMPAWPWLLKVGRWAFEHHPAMIAPLIKSILAAHMSPSPELFLAGGVLVGSRGVLVDPPTAAQLALTGDGAGYVIGDRTLYTALHQDALHISTAPGIAYATYRDYRRARKDLTHQAESLDGLAARTGVPVTGLRGALGPDSAPPYLALGPVYAAITITEGGLSVDRRCNVCRPGQEPIQGLYAAGGTAQAGMLLLGHGLHLAWALTSGRIAGRHANGKTALSRLHAPAMQQHETGESE
jgi:fumarate reductase flavoprotein subunit